MTASNLCSFLTRYLNNNLADLIGRMVVKLELKTPMNTLFTLVYCVGIEHRSRSCLGMGLVLVKITSFCLHKTKFDAGLDSEGVEALPP